MTGDLQSIVVAKDQDKQYIDNIGGKVVYDQRYGVAGESNWRPFVEGMKEKGVEVVRAHRSSPRSWSASRRR